MGKIVTLDIFDFAASPVGFLINTPRVIDGVAPTVRRAAESLPVLRRRGKQTRPVEGRGLTSRRIAGASPAIPDQELPGAPVRGARSTNRLGGESYWVYHSSLCVGRVATSASNYKRALVRRKPIVRTL